MRDNKEVFDREFRTKQKLIRLMQEKIILEKINLSSYKNKSVLLKNMKNDFHFFFDYHIIYLKFNNQLNNHLKVRVIS